jgi:hypothetical protein
MAEVKATETGFEVDAGLIASAFRLEAASVPGLLRNQEITNRCETGIEDDAGRWRLIFFHHDRVLRLTVDGSGAVLQRATFGDPRRRSKLGTGNDADSGDPRQPGQGWLGLDLKSSEGGS